MIRTTK